MTRPAGPPPTMAIGCLASVSSSAMASLLPSIALPGVCPGQRKARQTAGAGGARGPRQLRLRRQEAAWLLARAGERGAHRGGKAGAVTVDGEHAVRRDRRG